MRRALGNCRREEAKAVAIPSPLCLPSVLSVFSVALPSLFSVASASLLSVALAGCPARSQAPAARPETVVPVEVITLGRRSLVRVYREMATFEAPHAVDVSAEVPGRVVALPRDVGDRVSEGEEICALDDAVPRAQRDQARAQVQDVEARRARVLAQVALGEDQIRAADATVREAETARDAARTNFARKEMLFRDHATSEAAYIDARDALASAEARVDAARAAAEAARAALDVTRAEIAGIDAGRAAAEASLAVAEATLRRYRVAAPIAGVVTFRRTEVGEMVAGGVPFIRIEMTDPLRAVTHVPEREAARVAAGQEVDVVAGDATLRGLVFRVAPSVDPATRTVEVEVDVPNSDGRIRPGGFGRVAFVLERREEVLAVPLFALRRTATGAAFVLACETADGGHVVRRRDLVLGLDAQGWVEVISGVALGETIVTMGAATLSDGARVEPRPAPTAEGGEAP